MKIFIASHFSHSGWLNFDYGYTQLWLEYDGVFKDMILDNPGVEL